MSLRKVHYVECHCGEEEGCCTCDTFCGRWIENPETTGIKRHVTCKRCLHWIPKAEAKS